VLVGGCETEVVFFDNNLQFDIERFAQILRLRLTKAILNTDDNNQPQQQQQRQLEQEEAKSVETSIRVALKRLRVVRCLDGTEFLATLKSLARMRQEEQERHHQLSSQQQLHHQQQQQQQHHRTRVVMIDSLASFYWTDRSMEAFGVARQRAYQQQLLHYLSSVDHNSLLVYTKPSLFLPKTPTPSSSSTPSSTSERGFDEYLGKQWEQLPKYRISLSSNLADSRLHPSHPSYLDNALSTPKEYFIQPSFIAQVTTAPSGTPSSRPHLFVVEDSGIVFRR